MKKNKSSKSTHLHQQNGHALPFKFAKLLDPEASWDKDQLGDVLHWIRQVVGLVYGLLCGAVPLVGAKWIVLYLVLSSSIVYGYYAHILKIDEEEFGGHGSLLQEGIFASLTLFLLAWILIHRNVQPGDFTGLTHMYQGKTVILPYELKGDSISEEDNGQLAEGKRKDEIKKLVTHPTAVTEEGIAKRERRTNVRLEGYNWKDIYTGRGKLEKASKKKL